VVHQTKTVLKIHFTHSGMPTSETFSLHAWTVRLFGIATRIQPLDRSDLTLVSCSTTFAYFEVKRRGRPSPATILKKNSKQRPDGCMTRSPIFSVGSHLCLSRFSAIHFFRSRLSRRWARRRPLGYTAARRQRTGCGFKKS